MANFFEEIDIVYCLSIPQRKEFVLSQVTRLGISHKIKIVDAYTQFSPIVKNILDNHYVYPIYTDNPTMVACTLGVREIMMDIVKNKYNYAMVVEDDVIFLDEMISHGTKWLTKTNIGKYFKLTHPYVLYLQSNAVESKYYDKTKSDGGIILKPIRYGEPAYITNHIACNLLLKHIFPITSPFDEYKNLVKSRYKIQQGILVPYICRELSGNYFKFNSSKLNCKFVRTLRINTASIYEHYANINYYLQINDTNGYGKLITFLLSKINPRIKPIINSSKIPSNIMSYHIGTVVDTICNNYVINGSFSDNINCINRNTFIVSVRGKKSFNLIKTKYNFATVIGDILLLYNKYVPKAIINKHKYCLIYNTNLTVKLLPSNQIIHVNPVTANVDTILDAISSSQYVLSNDINYITIANSYGIRGVYVSIDSNISKYHEIIAADYYSNIINCDVKPILLKVIDSNIIIDDKTELDIGKYFQPVLPVHNTTINNLINIVPFYFHKHSILANREKIAQIIK